MEAFEKLDVWKRSSRLCVALYKAFENCRDWAFKEQNTRAALSIPSNIAEGYERDLNREFAYFLRVAKGSAGELRTQLYVAAEIGRIGRESALGMVEEAREIARMIQGLIKSCSEA